HEKARTRQRDKPSHSISSATCDWVVRLIKQQWSPEQISDWLAETQSIRVSHESQVHTGKATRSKKASKKRMNKAMRFLQHHSERVRKYFRHSSIAYAA
ncbi:MAG: hypothetical protein ACWA5R_08865, partial [bacterium]